LREGVGAPLTIPAATGAATARRVSLRVIWAMGTILLGDDRFRLRNARTNDLFLKKKYPQRDV
jgi:hypothetical protein